MIIQYFFNLLFLAAALFPASASAHVLKTDGSIGAVLHIDPEDNPSVGEPASFFFEFKDRQGKFLLDKCDCTVAILRDGTTVFSTKLGSSPIVSYTFPEQGEYVIEAAGMPRIEGDFQPFTLRYGLQVDKESVAAGAISPATSNHTLHYILFGGAFGVFFLLLFRDKVRTGRNKKSGDKI
jgi:hypothetical protein